MAKTLLQVNWVYIVGRYIRVYLYICFSREQSSNETRVFLDGSKVYRLLCDH